MTSEFFGRTDYLKSLEIQEQLRKRVQADGARVHVLGFEYDPVVTLGVRGSFDSDVLEANTLPVLRVPRGGQATLHSPGQIVIYPICNIIFHGLKVKEWTSRVLKASQSALKQEGVETRCSDVGLFQEDAKVASLGLKIQRGVSTFGVAINLRNDVALFDGIRPCGVRGQKVAQVGYPGDMSAFFECWLGHFGAQFAR